MTIFDEQIIKAEQIAKFNKSRAYRLLDDLSTAYISNEFDSLDKSYYAVKTIRKTLSSMGYSIAEIDDYLIEHSYITKTRINKLRTQSIYMNDSITITPHIENIADRENKRLATDLIIDNLKSKSKLLQALKNNCTVRNLEITYNIKNAQLLKNFYDQHKDII